MLNRVIGIMLFLAASACLLLIVAEFRAFNVDEESNAAVEVKNIVVSSEKGLFQASLEVLNATRSDLILVGANSCCSSNVAAEFPIAIPAGSSISISFEGKLPADGISFEGWRGVLYFDEGSLTPKLFSVPYAGT